MFHSFMHHGSFSDVNKQLCLNKINERYINATEFIKETDTFFITFGTSYAFKIHDNNQIVSNCHKFPANKFERFRLTIKEIVKEWSELIEILVNQNSGIQFIFTVSPIRHFRDGAHDNQISKSILHIAIENIKNNFITLRQVSYSDGTFFIILTIDMGQILEFLHMLMKWKL